MSILTFVEMIEISYSILKEKKTSAIKKTQNILAIVGFVTLFTPIRGIGMSLLIGRILNKFLILLQA